MEPFSPPSDHPLAKSLENISMGSPIAHNPSLGILLTPNELFKLIGNKCKGKECCNNPIAQNFTFAMLDFWVTPKVFSRCLEMLHGIWGSWCMFNPWKV